MFSWVMRKVIGSQNEREIKSFKPIVEKTNSLEPEVSKLSDAQLRAKTDEFRKIIKDRTKDLDNELNELKDKFRKNIAPEERQELEEDIKRVKNDLKKETSSVLNEILPEAFAVVREAGKRTIGLRHFDVQLIGGMVLHEGKIAEMATGEGKTLVATLSAYLNAISGKGVHIVTVNDYLAKRDREWMGPIYELLGLSVGVIQHDLDQDQRKAAYGADITYGTNNEFGFDYLRDNMVIRKEDMVQRGHHYAIVDEVDSILIDEARTPLIISGPAEESTDLYYKADKAAKKLTEGKRNEETKEETGDYIYDEKAQTVHLTEQGEQKAAELMNLPNLYDAEYSEHRHHIIQALRAHSPFFKRDVQYMVKDGEVLIVDEFTGRLMPGRRWSDGLHQAIEAKEGMKIERENQTLATITFQNLFRMYDKLAGMTGTAATEANEFHHIYKLDVVVIPTNRPLIRTNYPDVIYRTEKEKFDAVVNELADLNSKQRPVLVGTISIEKSERLSALLKRKGVPHQVLNAKYHEKEAYIVAQAGRFGGVTIATNMAGRGTDIVLGGNAEYRINEELRSKGVDPHAVEPEIKNKMLKDEKLEVEKEHNKVVDLGGLHVLGTERHESRRIDNQLRGRSGRQGDPGSSKFYVALEDDLMRIFGSDRISFIMQRLGMEEGQEIQHGLVSKAIETAQKRVEGHNFEIRKHLLEFDNVMNRQREVIYQERRLVLEGENLKEHVFEMLDEVLDNKLDIYCPKGMHEEEWDLAGFASWLRGRFPIKTDDVAQLDVSIEDLKQEVVKRCVDAYEQKEKTIGPQTMRELEKIIMLQIIDSKWKDHLYAMDNLREGIGLRAYGQKDPLVEYTNEGFAMFSDMINRIKEETVELIYKVQAFHAERVVGVFETAAAEFKHEEVGQFRGAKPIMPQQEPETFGPTTPRLRRAGPPPYDEKPETFKREAPKVGRNDPCPCGSGKKYKHCCGK